MNRKDLNNLTKRDLTALAAEAGIRLGSRLRKSQMIDVLVGEIVGDLQRSRPLESGTTRSPPQTNGSSRSAPTDPPLSANKLREIAAEVDKAFPPKFGRTELVVLPIDPFHAHAFWNVCTEDLEEARSHLGEQGASARLILRFFDITYIDFDGSNAHSSFDLEVHSLQNCWYFDFWKSEKTYFVDLGLLGDDGSFGPLARSNMFHLPRHSPSPDYGRTALVLDDEGQIVCEIPDLSLASTFPKAQIAPSPGTKAQESEDLVRLFYRDLTRTASKGARHETKRMRFPSPLFSRHGSAAGRGESLKEAPTEVSRGPALRASRQVSGPIGAPTLGSQEGSDEGKAVLRGPEPRVELPLESSASGTDLEQLFSLSSYEVSSQRDVLEIRSEIRLTGRAKPGSKLTLFGKSVPLAPDGSFSVSRALPQGALVVPLMQSGGSGEAEDGGEEK